MNPATYAVGMYLQYALVFGPAALILFSRRAAAWTKARWGLIALLPWLVGNVAYLTLLLLASLEEKTELMMFGFPDWLYVATWVGGWTIYLAFLRHLKRPVPERDVRLNA